MMLALLAGGLWWQTAEQVRGLQGRTRLVIAAILGDGRPRSRDEITRELRLQLPPLRVLPLRWLNLPERALAEMTRQGILVLTGDKYTAAPTGPARR
jgi:hypothetical protein